MRFFWKEVQSPTSYKRKGKSYDRGMEFSRWAASVSEPSMSAFTEPLGNVCEIANGRHEEEEGGEEEEHSIPGYRLLHRSPPREATPEAETPSMSPIKTNNSFSWQNLDSEIPWLNNLVDESFNPLQQPWMMESLNDANSTSEDYTVPADGEHGSPAHSSNWIGASSYDEADSIHHPDSAGCSDQTISQYLVGLQTRDVQPEVPVKLCRHLDELPCVRVQMRLVQHWIIEMSDILMPIPGLRNPLKNIFVPIAYQGAQAPSSESSGATALFHLICASSAFHLSSDSKSVDGSPQMESLALQHYNCAIRHLQGSILKHDPSQYEALLASLVMCMFYETVTVPTSFWRLHVRGAMKWLNEVDRRTWTQSESCAILYQMIVAIIVFIQSHVMFDEDPSFADLHWDINPLTGVYVLDQIFGISLTTLTNIIAMNKFLLLKSQTPFITQNNTEDLDLMELEFYLSLPKRPIEPLDKAESNMTFHYLNAYYFASLVYFKRVMRGAPTTDVQSLVEQSVEHLEALFSCTMRPFSPLLWVIAVPFFEATGAVLQRRILSWLEQVTKKTGLHVWCNFKKLVSELWKTRVTTEQPDMQWHVFFKGVPGSSIMML